MNAREIIQVAVDEYYSDVRNYTNEPTEENGRKVLESLMCVTKLGFKPMLYKQGRAVGAIRMDVYKRIQQLLNFERGTPVDEPSTTITERVSAREIDWLAEQGHS